MQLVQHTFITSCVAAVLNNLICIFYVHYRGDGLVRKYTKTARNIWNVLKINSQQILTRCENLSPKSPRFLRIDANVVELTNVTFLNDLSPAIRQILVMMLFEMCDTQLISQKLLSLTQQSIGTISCPSKTEPPFFLNKFLFMYQ